MNEKINMFVYIHIEVIIPKYYFLKIEVNIF